MPIVVTAEDASSAWDLTDAKGYHGRRRNALADIFENVDEHRLASLGLGTTVPHHQVRTKAVVAPLPAASSSAVASKHTCVSDSGTQNRFKIADAKNLNNSSSTAASVRKILARFMNTDASHKNRTEESNGRKKTSMKRFLGKPNFTNNASTSMHNKSASKELRKSKDSKTSFTEHGSGALFAMTGIRPEDHATMYLVF